MKKIIKEYQARLAIIEQGGTEAAKKRHKEHNKLPVRKRIESLIDPNTPFMELSSFAGYELYETPLPAGGIITGIATIQNTLCMIIANDPTIKGGTYYPITLKKHLRAQEIAEKNQLPCIYIVDSGGAFLPLQDEVFPDKEHFGRIFYNQARMSANNIPQIAIVTGMCTAGGAYIPAMADISIMVKHQATIFLGGPPLVQAATGEIISAEELGGADVHCRKSGVADYYAEDEHDAFSIARKSILTLNRPNESLIASHPSTKPKLSSDTLLGIIPIDSRVPIEMKDIIACITDNSEFDEFKKYYATTLICAFAHIDGKPVGIIANNGILFSESALKGTQFIQLCNKRHIPMLFLQNITGFMIGKNYEEKGIAKDGAKMVNAIACSQVPKMTIIIGGSFGAGNYAMCGRAYNPDFLAIWPNAKIAVMGAEQAANVLTQVKVEQFKRLGQTWDETEKQKLWDKIYNDHQTKSSAYYASARLWDDAIINPTDTRSWVIQCLKVTSQQTPKQSSYGVFRM